MNEFRNLPRERIKIYAAGSTSSSPAQGANSGGVLQEVIVNGLSVPQLAQVSA